MNFKRGIGFTQELAMEDERGVKDDPRISDLSSWKMEYCILSWWRLLKNGCVGARYEQLWFGDVTLLGLSDVKRTVGFMSLDSGKVFKVEIKFGNH